MLSLPRFLAMILLLVSIAMVIPIGASAIRIVQGQKVDALALSVPMVIMAVAAFLTWLLSRKQMPISLFLMAFVLWLLTAGYYFVRFVI
jgi:hypothetical protein